MGPITLFDKSFLQSLSLDESIFFDRFFAAVICPIFFIETLADLEKKVREGRTPEQEVGIIADKVPELHSEPCAFHVDLAARNLLGMNLPMDGRIPTAGAKAVRVDGKPGFVHSISPESEALNRWQNREFLDVERAFAQTWRKGLTRLDLDAVRESVRRLGISPQTCKSFEHAKKIVDASLSRQGNQAAQQLNAAARLIGISAEYTIAISRRWRFIGRPSLTFFAPYAAYVLAVELFFQAALGANLISTQDVNNRTDVGYLFYAPFCHIFVSSDKFHRSCAPHFLRKDQSFVWGPELKADLSRLVEYFAARSDAEKEQGLFRLAPSPPKEDAECLTGKLWDRHLLRGWRERGKPETRDPELDAKIMREINRTTSAPSLSPKEVDFEPTDAGFVTIHRRISRRRGQWWIVPKDAR